MEMGSGRKVGCSDSPRLKSRTVLRAAVNIELPASLSAGLKKTNIAVQLLCLGLASTVLLFKQGKRRRFNTTLQDAILIYYIL